jgi:hypothetical protein
MDQPTDADGIFVHTVGDTSLVPERILTGEFGAHDESSPYHQADAAIYVNRVTNIIALSELVREYSFYDPEANGFSAGTTGFENLDEVYTAVGGELDTRFFPVDGLDVYANVSFERVLTQDGLDESVSLFKGNTGIMYRTPYRTDVSIHVSYVSPQVWRLRDFDETGALLVTEEPIPARTILSGRVAVRPFVDEGLEIAVDAWNVLALDGRTFREHPKGQLVGPRAWGEATWHF